MEKFLISVNGESMIAVYTDIDSVSRRLKNNPEGLTKTIPATVAYLGEVSNITESENFITVLGHNKKMISVDREANTAALFSPQDQFFFPDLVYLAIGMFANDLQRKGLYFMQSSVVKYDDEHSIMLIGDPNAGKTSMAYSLMKANGYKLISNDNVLVGLDENGRLKTHCGTKMVQMRYGGIKLYFPEILPFVHVDEEDKGRSDWDIKLYIDDYLKSRGFEYADESIVTDIYNITTFKSGDTFVRSRERIDEVLLMYQHLTGQIRSTRYALTGYRFPLPSFEDERYIQDRYDIAERICETTSIYEARGTVDELTKKLGKRNG